MSDSPQPALSLWPDLDFTQHFESCMSCCSNEHERVSIHVSRAPSPKRSYSNGTENERVPIRILRAPSPNRSHSNGTEIKLFKKHMLPYPVHHENALHNDAMHHHDAREGVPVHWSANAAHHRHRPPSPVRRIGHDGEAHPHREQPLRGPRSPSPQRRSPSPQRKHRHGEAYHGPKITALSGGGSRTEVSYMLTEAKTLFLCQSCPCMRMHVKSCIQASLAELPVHMIYLARHIRGLPPPFCLGFQDFLHGNERTVHNGGQYIPTLL